MPQILWTRYFLEAQGYQIHDSVVYQDNQSAMLLANNGRASSSKQTCHMNIRYFFVTNRIQAGDLRVEYCPTDDMIADFFTKPLQGSKFTRFRDQVLNYSLSPILQPYPLKGVCWGVKHRPTTYSGAAKECNEANCARWVQTRWGEGRAAPPNRIITFFRSATIFPRRQIRCLSHNLAACCRLCYTSAVQWMKFIF